MIRSFAATGDVVAFEAEQGMVSGNAQVVADTTASGGQYAVLNAKAATPPPPPPAPTPPPPAPTPPPPASTGKKLILFEQSAAPITSVINNVARLDALPFDGMFITNSFSQNIQSTTPLNAAAVNAEFARITPTTFQHMKNNWAMFYAVPNVPYTNYAQVAANFKIVATAARNSGFKGIFFDDEEYFTSSAWDGASCAGMDDNSCHTAAYNAGQQVMRAVIEAWPTAQMLVAHGPYVSAAETGAVMNRYINYPDVAWANKQVGYFQAGMVKATVGTQARFHDGGELYQGNTSAQFLGMADWRKNGMANTAVVPADLKANWSQYLHISNGLWDFSVPLWGKSGSPAQLQNDIIAAAPATEEWEWVYTERHDWSGYNNWKPQVPSDWMNAVRTAYNQMAR